MGILDGVTGTLGNFFDSSNRNMKAEELVLELDRLGLQGILSQNDMYKLLVGGGPFTQSSVDVKGGNVYGLLGEQPQGPAFNLVQGGLQQEEALANQRFQIAQQLLGGFANDYGVGQQFGQQQLGLGLSSLGQQENQLQALANQALTNTQIGGQLGNTLQEYFATGGAPSTFQQQAIGDVYNAQRQIGQSNLQQQFQDFARTLNEELAPARGLRGSDSPIQHLGERTMQEYLRNAANLEAGLGGQEASAMLQAPYQQAQLGLAGMGQLQGANLDILNSFSVPITQAFNQQQGVNQMGQYATQFAPAQFAGPSLTNLFGLLGQGNFAQGTTNFSNSIAVKPQDTPGFLTRFGNAFSGSAGQSLGQATGMAAGAAMSHPKYKTDIAVMPEGTNYVRCLESVDLCHWVYAQDPHQKPRVGGLTTQMPAALVTPDLEQLDVVSYLGVLTGAIQQLSAELTQLRDEKARREAAHGAQ